LSKRLEMDRDSLDLYSIIRKLGEKKFFLLKYVVLFVLIGLIIGFISPNRYVSSLTFMPSSSEKSLPGGLNSLASIAGVNLGGMTSASEISPMSYPQLLISTSFKQELLNSKVRFLSNPLSLEEYLSSLPISKIDLLKKYTIGLPKLLLSKISGSSDDDISNDEVLVGVTKLSEEQESLFRSIQSSLMFDFNGQTNVATMSFETLDPVVAAQVVTSAKEILQNRIIQIRIQSASNKLEFIRRQYDQRKLEIQKLQDELALYKDSNRAITSELAEIKLNRLQTSLDIENGVFQELAIQVEQAQIAVQEDTPIFTTVDQAIIPIYRKSPKKFMLLVIWTLMGIVSGSFIILVSEPLRKIREDLISGRN
jgi:LPS O-antigen subunit length determinant protein (WzzB/FepE family)